MKTLTTVEFTPPGSLKIHLSEQVDKHMFSASIDLSLFDLSEDQQANANIAFAWLTEQLGSMQLQIIILERWSDGIHPVFDFETGEQIAAATDHVVAAVQGSCAAGSIMIPQGALVSPAEINTNLLALWDTIEKVINDNIS